MMVISGTYHVTQGVLELYGLDFYVTYDIILGDTINLIDRCMIYEMDRFGSSVSLADVS